MNGNREYTGMFGVFHVTEREVTQVLMDCGNRLITYGVHGVGHWMNVSDNAQTLAEQELTAEEQELVVPYLKLFALFHDSQRTHDGECPEHGPRAAEYFKEKWMSKFVHLPLGESGLYKLAEAMEVHTTCQPRPDRPLGGLLRTPCSLILALALDADRLDLPRVGIIPSRQFLFTETARSYADTMR